LDRVDVGLILLEPGLHGEADLYGLAVLGQLHADLSTVEDLLLHQEVTQALRVVLRHGGRVVQVAVVDFHQNAVVRGTS